MTSAQERIGVTNTGPDGSSWRPSHRAEREGGPTLHDTGMLMRSIVSRPGPRHVLVGTNMPYAAVHQEGAAAGSLGVSTGTDKRGRSFVTASPWGDIPARPYLGVSDEDYETIGDIAQLHFAGLLGGVQ